MHRAAAAGAAARPRLLRALSSDRLPALSSPLLPIASSSTHRSPTSAAVRTRLPQRRPLRTSAPALAQPLPSFEHPSHSRPFEEYFPRASSSPAHPAAPPTVRGNSSTDDVSTAGEWEVSPPRPPPRRRDPNEPPPDIDYEPTDADFDFPAPSSSSFSSSSAVLPDYPAYKLPYEPAASPTMPPPPEHLLEPPGPDPISATARAKILRAARLARKEARKGVMLDLPELPAGQMPPDGRTRFDWRQRALSRRREKAVGLRWFPGEERIRVDADFEKVRPGQAMFEEIRRYKKHFEDLLMSEFEEEERLFKERLEDWSLHRLIKEGWALVDLGGSAKFQPRGKSKIVTFSKVGKGAGALPFNRFTMGTDVHLSRTDPNRDPVCDNGFLKDCGGTGGWIRGRVYSSNRGFIRVEFPGEIAGIETGLWRLDVGLSKWALHKQMEAIDSLNLDPAKQDMAEFPLSAAALSYLVEDEALSSAAHHLASPEQTILQGTTLRDKLLRAFQQDYVPHESAAFSVNARTTPTTPDGIVQSQHELKPTDVDATPRPSRLVEAGTTGILARNQLIQSWTTRVRDAKGEKGGMVQAEGDPVVGLNASQMRAMGMMLSERLSLVQGPPGTGKTRVIIETIKLLKLHWEVPFPILVTAHTNVAVDNLLDGLRAHGVKAVRAGAVERVRPGLEEWTLDSRAQEHPLYEDVMALEEEKEALFRSDCPPELRGNRMRRKAEITNKLYVKKQIMFSEVLKDADVVCTTCLSASSRLLKHIDFPMVFLDEASMATEPLSLLPLMKGSSHVAIIGDHKQLPPVIISPEAQGGGLATSLFERLIHERHVPSIMLDTQYRMHPLISAFPSQAFYASQLLDGTVDESTRQPLPAFRPPTTAFLVRGEDGQSRNVTFLDHDYPESHTARSVANHGDAEIICDVVTDLLLCNPDLKGSSIGIIAPYTSQIRLLDTLLNADAALAARLSSVLGPERMRELAEIEIKTVDGFEGREKEVIVFSCVRSNAHGRIGFMADWRRLNVGLTRAKRALIMVGSVRTLEAARIGVVAEESLPQGGAEVWREFVRFLRREGLIVRASVGERREERDGEASSSEDKQEEQQEGEGEEVEKLRASG